MGSRSSLREVEYPRGSSPPPPFFFLLQTLPNISGAERDVCPREQLVPESGPRPEVSRRLFGKMSGLNAAPGNKVQPFYVFEYFPHRTVLNLPEDATALLRFIAL